MSKLTLPKKLCCVLAFGALLAPASAFAHVEMLEPLLSRGGDQKKGPCEGKAWGSGPVYTFEPGATIKLTARESISHDGYFRIAFARSEADLKDPLSIDPINPDRYGPGQKCAKNNPKDNCGESDFCKFVSRDGGSTVLWDKLDPHIPNGLFNGKQWSWNVQLPDVECEKCTIQVIQVMEDAQSYLGPIPVETHGPFDGYMDLYWRCVDVVLKRGAGQTLGTTTEPATNNGINCVPPANPDGEVPPPDMDGDDVVVVVPDPDADGSDPGSIPGNGDGHDHGDGADHDSDADPITGGNPQTGGGTKLPTTNSESGCSVSQSGMSGAAWSLLGMLSLLGLSAYRRRAARRA